MALVWILGGILAGSIGAVLAAGCLLWFGRTVRRRVLPLLVSYATGSLLGGAFLGLLPHALAEKPARVLLPFVLAGILLFFILEKLVIWRHCHVENCKVHSAAGPLIIIGDAVHNFADGVIIAAAFLTSIDLGIAATLAVVAHEIPQEVGDFAVLLDSGYSPRRALVLNLASSCSALAGGLLAYLSMRLMDVLIPYVLAVSAASFIYVAVADLIPGLQQHGTAVRSVQQVLFVAFGAATIWLFHH